MSALTGMVGSFVGVLATIAVSWIKHKADARRELSTKEIAKREALYGDFVGECARLLVDSFLHDLEKPETLLNAYALVNRIRLCASQDVLVEAERLLTRIADQYFAANLSVQELRALTHSTDGDPLMRFGEACRAELQVIQAHA
ncbi:MAG: hypothetical protein M3O62_09350 [Pseudomonadota bacterium]|nr:hypothetical protein [Pseudomonadota bacterium]